MTFKSEWLDWKAGSVSNVSESDTHTQEFCHTKNIVDNVISIDKTTEVSTERTDRTDKTPELTFYEDQGERWYQDANGRFWYVDRMTGKRTELVPSNRPEGEPLPRAFFEAFGSLLGIVISRRVQ